MGKKFSSDKKSANSNPGGELRIIGGKWRSRKISFLPVSGLRPSPSRIRETLFSWLAPVLPGSHCLDLFAGSGALGFEALSRGAAKVTMVEQNKQVIKQLHHNKTLLEASQLQILSQDARCLSSLTKGFDIVFCDPPFYQGLIQPLLDNLLHSKLLNPSARIYVETEKSLTSLSLANDWSLLKEKTAGDVRYRLIQVGEH